MTEPMPSLVEVTALQKVIGQTTVIDIPSLQVKSGQGAAIVGPVDSNKDVLFRLLVGTSKPTAGSVRLGGLDPYIKREACSRFVGVLFGDDCLYKRMSVIGNLRFFSRLYRLPEARVSETLEKLGLADQAQNSVEKLPPGLARRLALGRVILTQPRILLLENPFAGCEQGSISVICQVVREYVESGAAVVVFTVDTTSLELFCSTIYRFALGRIVETYSPAEVDHPAQPFMIAARAHDAIVLVDPKDILYVVAQNDRAYLQTNDERLLTQFTLSELEKRLSRSGFFRCHRAYLVNLQQVKEVTPYTRNSFTLCLKDASATQIPLSKSAERDLRELLGY